MDKWPAIVIIILIAVILVDGLRRMHRARKDSVKLSKNARKADEINYGEEYTSDLPSGGARVAKHRDEDDARSLNQNVKARYEASHRTHLERTFHATQDEKVPVLMDTVDEVSSLRSEPSLGTFSEMDDSIEMDVTTPDSSQIKQAINESGQGADSESAETVSVLDDDFTTETSDDILGLSQKTTTPINSETKHESSQQEPDDVLIINVMAKSGYVFNGQTLSESFQRAGLNLGQMSIYHRHLENNPRNALAFSVANMMVPGIFASDDITSYETAGISFFLSLPCSGQAISNYDNMVATAKQMAEELEGEIKDENRSIMTRQTIEHERQRVIEYERKKRLQQVEA